MTPAEAAALLTIAAAYDNRKPDADQAKAWAMALDDLRFEDCRTVIVEHYKRSRDWLMPVDVRRGVQRLRYERIDAFGPIPEPEGIDPDDKVRYQRARLEMQTAIADGTLTRDALVTEELGRRRDVIAELGHIGQTVDSAMAARPLREALDEAKRERQEAEAEKKRAEDARRAELDRVRREEQAARAALVAAKGTDEQAVSAAEEADDE